MLPCIMHYFVQDVFGLDLEHVFSLFEAPFRIHAPMHPDAYDDALNGRNDHVTAIRAATGWEVSCMIVSQFMTLASEIMACMVQRHGHRLVRVNEQWHAYACTREASCPRLCPGRLACLVAPSAPVGRRVVTVQPPKSTAAARALNRLSSAMWPEAEFAGEVRLVSKRAQHATEWRAKPEEPFDFLRAAQTATTEVGGGSERQAGQTMIGEHVSACTACDASRNRPLGQGIAWGTVGRSRAPRSRALASI